MFSFIGKYFNKIAPSSNVEPRRISLPPSSQNIKSRWGALPSLIQRRQFGDFIRLSGKPKMQFDNTWNAGDSFLELASSSKHTILQFTDLHHYNNGSKEDAEGIQLIGTVAERVKPDSVVLTGDIIDGRYCGNYKCFRNVVAPLIDLGIPWTYIPGNHDDETKNFTKKDLLKVLSFPLCASRFAQSFTHALRVGPMQIYLVDSNGYARQPSANLDTVTYDYIKEDQIEWYNKMKSDAEVGLAFFHIPLMEFKQSKVLVGSKGETPCTPVYNSGFFRAARDKKDIHAMFVGHDHWNDFVSELEGVWLSYGRVSGFTRSAVYGNQNHVANKKRGGRVIRYDSSRKVLSTWVENKRGMEQDSVVSKGIVNEKFSVLE